MSFRAAAAQARLTATPGKGAMQNRHRRQLGASKATRLVASVDVDAHFKRAEPNASRWDYAIGCRQHREFVIWIECHPASSTKEVAVVLRKLQWLEAKLALPQFSKLAELTQSAPTAKQFNWLYAGNNALRSGSQQARDLALQGLSLPRRHLTI